MKRFVTLICVAVLCGTIAAQQNSSPDATKQGSDGQKNGGTEPSPALSGTDFDQYDVSSLPQAEQFHVLGGARLLQSGPGGIRLGPVRLGEVIFPVVKTGFGTRANRNLRNGSPWPMPIWCLISAFNQAGSQYSINQG